MDYGPAENFHKMVGLISSCTASYDGFGSHVIYRLNTKIASRDLEVKDLVKDLSDGVSGSSAVTTLALLKNIFSGHPHSFA